MKVLEAIRKVPGWCTIHFICEFPEDIAKGDDPVQWHYADVTKMEFLERMCNPLFRNGRTILDVEVKEMHVEVVTSDYRYNGYPSPCTDSVSGICHEVVQVMVLDYYEYIRRGVKWNISKDGSTPLDDCIYDSRRRGDE